MKSNLSKLVGSAVFAAGLALAFSSTANAANLDFSFDQFTGDAAEVDISVSDTADGLGEGDLLFTVKVGEGYIADITGLYFNISDDSLLSGLSVAGLNGVDISATEFNANSVSKVGGQYNNLNGGGRNRGDDVAFDIGVAFGGGGASPGDDYQEASFILSHNSTNLTLSQFSLQDFGVRLKSVGANREGSSKLLGTSTEYVAEIPETPEVPEVPETPDNPVAEIPETPETPETPYTPPQSVPEPGMTGALGLLAIGGLCYRKRNRKS
ncbi:MAG: PEP-CTERM sorting domain-containing protein [Oscillatoria sp. PMC 1051.18]|nr:PEP-CTERM sorting domain-containing protein [Oscillatoria sp. PMC 1050.18]MEC5032357.1 PEP-CTERM sorting domain-containing protein [Oscillatoria sp. PMC 1051.18]